MTHIPEKVPVGRETVPVAFCLDCKAVLFNVRIEDHDCCMRPTPAPRRRWLAKVLTVLGTILFLTLAFFLSADTWE